MQFTNCTALSDASLFQSHFQEKKFWAVQFVNCIALSEATLWQSHLQEKKFGRCNLQIAPPYLMPVYFSHLQEKKFWAVQFTNCTAQGGRAVYALPFQVQFSDIPENCCRKEKYWSNHLQP